jgi:hypothetical protein
VFLPRPNLEEKKRQPSIPSFPKLCLPACLPARKEGKKPANPRAQGDNAVDMLFACKVDFFFSRRTLPRYARVRRSKTKRKEGRASWWAVLTLLELYAGDLF